MHSISIMAAASLFWGPPPVLPAEQQYSFVAEAPAPQRIAFAQGDPRWGSLRYSGERSLDEAGCLIFALLMIAREEGFDYEPLDFVRQLQRFGSFDARGNLYWATLREATSLDAERLFTRGEAAFSEARQLLEGGTRVALQVRTPRGTRHWVAGIELEDDDIVILDPGNGRETTLQRSYGARALLGLAAVRPA